MPKNNNALISTIHETLTHFNIRDPKLPAAGMIVADRHCYPEKYRSTLDYLGKKVLEIVEQGDFAGRRTLELYHYYAGSVRLYHGSPLSPKEMGFLIEPRQAYWVDARMRRFTHGEPAVCLDTQIDFPIMRALLKEDTSPVLSNMDLNDTVVLSVRNDFNEKPVFVTSARVYNALNSQAATGHVHLVERPKDCRAYFDNIQNRELNEIRWPESLLSLGSVAVRAYDLPEHLIVADAPRSKLQPALARIPRVGPVAAFDEAGIEAQRLDGMWPLEYWTA